MSRIDCWHRKIFTNRHFQNGHHNTAQVQYLWWPFWKWRLVEIFRCQQSIRDIIIYLHMKCRWNRTMLNLCGIVAAILKMFFQCRESIRDIIIYTHIKFRWYRTMLNFCGIVAATFKMAIGRNFDNDRDIKFDIVIGHH
jgi:hypothetical protein